MEVTCELCTYKTILHPLLQQQDHHGSGTQVPPLLHLRKRMSQGQREVLNIILDAKWDLSKICFCDHLNTLESIILSRECEYFKFKSSKI